jgi:hypothetical protein
MACLSIAALAIVATIATGAAAKDPAPEPKEIADWRHSPPHVEHHRPPAPPHCDEDDRHEPEHDLRRPEDLFKDGWKQAQRGCEHRPHSP